MQYYERFATEAPAGAVVTVMVSNRPLGVSCIIKNRHILEKQFLTAITNVLANDIGGIFLSLHRKNGLFCNREQPKLFIQRCSLNIMDVLCHKRFGCSAVYDKDFLRQDTIGGFGAKNG